MTESDLEEHDRDVSAHNIFTSSTFYPIIREQSTRDGKSDTLGDSLQVPPTLSTWRWTLHSGYSCMGCSSDKLSPLAATAPRQSYSELPLLLWSLKMAHENDHVTTIR